MDTHIPKDTYLAHGEGPAPAEKPSLGKGTNVPVTKVIMGSPEETAKKQSERNKAAIFILVMFFLHIVAGFCMMKWLENAPARDGLTKLLQMGATAIGLGALVVGFIIMTATTTGLRLFGVSFKGNVIRTLIVWPVLPVVILIAIQIYQNLFKS